MTGQEGFRDRDQGHRFELWPFLHGKETGMSDDPEGRYGT